MISVHVGDNQAERELVESFFDIQTETDIISDYCASEFYKPHTVGELLRTDYSKEVFWEEAVECTPNDTVSRRKIWEDNPQIVGIDGKINLAFDTIRTITTKQDRNPNSGNLYFDSGIDDRAKFRYLTPRECLLFMGFTDADYENLKNNNIEFHRNVYNTKYLNCFNQAVKWDDSSREQYHSILKQADSMEYVSREYYDGSMLDRNHHLVEVAGVLLVVYNDEQRLR